MALLGNQEDVRAETPLLIDSMDNTSTVNPIAAETLTFYYNDGGTKTAAAGEAAGTLIYAKLKYDGVLNGLFNTVGNSLDTSLVYTGTSVTTQVRNPGQEFVNSLYKKTLPEKFTAMATVLLTNGDYFIDHENGAIWGLSAALVAGGDTVDYSVKTIAAGGSVVAAEVDLTKVGGTAVNDGGVAGALGVGGTTADGAVDAGNPVGIGGLALAAQRAAVAAAGRVKAVFNLFGEIVIAGYTWATNSIRTEEIDPLDQKYLDVNLADTTNVSAATHYYPASTGATMDGYKDQSMTGKFIDADGTLTLTLEVSNDEDPATADWNGAYFYDDELNSTVSSKTVTNGTELFSLSVNNNNFRLYRWVVIASGATNTVILKERKKAL